MAVLTRRKVDDAVRAKLRFLSPFFWSRFKRFKERFNPHSEDLKIIEFQVDEYIFRFRSGKGGGVSISWEWPSYLGFAVLRWPKLLEYVHWNDSPQWTIPAPTVAWPIDRYPAAHFPRHRKREWPCWPLRSRWRDSMRNKSKRPAQLSRSRRWCRPGQRRVMNRGLRSVRKSSLTS